VTRRTRRLVEDAGGASAVEFAIVVPMFLLVIFGIVEFGQYLWTSSVLQQTAVQTARCMGVLQSQCASAGVYSSSNSTGYGQTVAAGYGLGLANSNFTLSRAASCAGVTGFSQVTVSYRFYAVVPVVTAMMGGVPMTATACFPNRS
jgi:Flp pilus assembly protein TadG